MVQSSDDHEFSELLLEWGLITRQELEDASRLHETATRNGSAAPAFTETLIKYGFLTPRQVAEARSADAKGVFYCPACAVGFEVRISASRRNYQCPRCQGPLQREAGSVPARATTSLLSDHVPVDVQVALHNPDTKFGKYVLLAEVGRGGAAVIRKAWDSEEKTYVALKFLRPQEGADPEKVEALIREGERAVYLRHPNLIRVYELGYINRQYYIAMEYLEGYTLAELIRSALLKSKVSPFYDDPTRYLTMLRDVARAVHYAHSRTPPLVHCDLKPGNIFVELSWRPYVLDFGVARELNPGAKEVEEGLVKGSPAYMAPEQVLGKPDEIDARTDVYGLGAILYDLLAGRPPLTGELQEVLDKNLLMVGVPTPSEVLKTRGEISGGGTARSYRVPPEVEAICMKCLAKEKKDRYASAKDVADALAQVIRARPLTQVQKPETTRRIVSQTPPAMPVVTPTPVAPLEARGAAARPKGGSKWPVAVASVALAAVAVAAIWRLTVPPPGPAPEAALQESVNRRIAAMDFDAAESDYAAFAERHPEKAAWVKAQRDDLAAVREMRDALAATLTRTMPSLRTLDLRKRQHKDVKVVQATEDFVSLIAEGARVEIPWGAIEPAQIVKWAFDDRQMPPLARLGLAIYAQKCGLKMEAGRAAQSLKGTEYAARAFEVEKAVTEPE